VKTNLVDSSYPPGEEAWKGSAVRRLKGYASWVRQKFLAHWYLVTILY